MPKSVPAKADAEVQRRFIEETLAPLMAQASETQPVYFIAMPRILIRRNRASAGSARVGNAS